MNIQSDSHNPYNNVEIFYYKTYIQKHNWLRFFQKRINYKLHVQKLISFEGDSINFIIDLEGEEQVTLGSFR